MPSYKQKRQIFDNFDGGDYGITGGYKAPQNTFRALNMIKTSDGGLMPRPGLKDRSSASIPNGKVVGMVPTATAGATMMLIIGNKVYTYDIDDGSDWDEIGTLDVTPTLAVFPKRSTTSYYITIPGDKSYELDPVSGTINPLAGSPGGTEIEVFGQRLLVAGADEDYRVQFSAAGDFEDWPSENFFDVGDFWQITAMREQNNYLIIAKRNSWHVFSGVPGTTSAVVRRASRERGPLHPGQVEIDQSDLMYVITAFRQNPATFDSVNVRQIAHLQDLGTARDGDTPTLPVVLGVAESMGDNSHSTVLIAQGGDQNNFLLFHNNTWTRHTTSIDISGMVRGGETGDFYLTDGGDTGTPANIYSIFFGDDRPAFAADGINQPGDNSTTPVNAWVTLPEIWSESGEQIAVRNVVVTFDKYNTGAAGTNHFDIEVVMLGRTPAGTDDASVETKSWDEAQSGAGSAGQSRRDRKNQGFQTSRAAGAQVSLTNVRGVKIQSVEVVWDVFPQTGTNS